jgi:hypothetical protein
MFTGLDVLALVDCLGQAPPVELKGLELLRQLRPLAGAWFPQLPAAVLAEATAQIIDYTEACAATVRKLQVLPPVTLGTLPIMEFCL